jgi:RND superfamily putative drug exporter
MHVSGFTGRTARATARHPWRTVGVWVVALAAAFMLAGGLGDVLTEDGDLTVTVESEQADDLIAAHFPSDDAPPREFVLVESTGETVDEPGFRATVAALAADLGELPTVQSVVSYLDGAPGLTSEDGTVALLLVDLAGAGDGSDLAAPVVDVVAGADAAGAYTVTTIGNGSVNAEFTELADETLRQGEILGLPAALVILVVVFGAVVAAGIPLVLAVVSILAAVGMTVVVGQAFELSFFVINMITMIGLAVGIDYSLFVVQRFREERAKGLAVIDAVERAGDSATRAVFFSGMTVVIALLGLLYMPDTVMRSLGIGAILVVVAAVAAALTLLPAVLGLLGDRVNRLRVPFLHGTSYHEGGGRFWHRITAVVTARPLVSMLLAGGLLLAAAAPYLTLETGQNGIDSLPADSPSKHAFTVLNEEFDTGTISTWVVVDGAIADPLVAAATDELVAALEADAAYGEVTATPSPDGEILLVEAVTKLDPSTQEARVAVTDLRSATIPSVFGGVDADVLVTGDAAWTADYVGVLDSRTPTIFVFVLGLSFLLLMAVFRSIVVPLKAIIMNLLSVGAAYGLLVLVFQHGVGAGLFGFQQTDVIEAWIPLFLFAVLFGLSMDYHIFLLSRIKERYDVTGDNDGSVAFGLGSTGAIITGAALIMVAVFGGFAAGDLVMFQQMGFGLGVAVILDATIVRSVLVPATMKLLGARNWYFPKWLGWLPEIHIEGRPDPVALRHGERVPEPVGG